MNEQLCLFLLSDKCCLDKAELGTKWVKEKLRDHSASSAERPHLQLHDSEVVGFWEATVIEGVAGAAATQV